MHAPLRIVLGEEFISTRVRLELLNKILRQAQVDNLILQSLPQKPFRQGHIKIHW